MWVNSEQHSCWGTREERVSYVTGVQPSHFTLPTLDVCSIVHWSTVVGRGSVSRLLGFLFPDDIMWREHLLVGLPVICSSSSGNCLFLSVAQFLIRLFIFFLFYFEVGPMLPT